MLYPPTQRRTGLNFPTERHLTTLLYLLRGYAEQQRRTHGPLVERPGGIELTPTEMETWADELEALPDNSTEDWLK